MAGIPKTRRWHRPSARLGVVAVLASVVALGATAGTASAAAPPYSVSVGIDSAAITTNGGPNGNCAWLVKASATVYNYSAHRVTVANVNGLAGSVTWDVTHALTPNLTLSWPNSGVVPAVSPGGVPGQLSTTAIATFTIPCSATSGDLAIRFVITDQSTNPPTTTTMSGDAYFLVNGTEVPVYAGIAGFVFALGLGVFLFGLLRHRRRQKALAS